MKTTDRTERITRWLDGAMSAQEKTAFETEMQADPALREEVASLEQIGGMIRAHAAFEKPVPQPDFFNSQIQERISGLQMAEERRHARPGSIAAWLGWLRAPWAVAGAAALVALGLVIFIQGGKPQTQVISLYIPDPAVSGSVNYNNSADATVLMLDGLKAIPDERPITGLSVHHSENDPEMASTTLYDEDGNVLLVMATDARSRPVLIGRNTH